MIAAFRMEAGPYSYNFSSLFFFLIYFLIFKVFPSTKKKSFLFRYFEVYWWEACRLPCVLELECLTNLLPKVFCGQRGERDEFFCADGRSTVQRSLVNLLISSTEADSEEVQFSGSLTINSIPNLVLFLHFFRLKTLWLRFIMSLSSLPFLCLICILYRAYKHGLSAS